MLTLSASFKAEIQARQYLPARWKEQVQIGAAITDFSIYAAAQ
jgi:hypothetical protein